MSWEVWGWYVVVPTLIIYVVTNAIYTIKDIKKRIQAEKKLQELESRIEKLKELSKLRENFTEGQSE